MTRPPSRRGRRPGNADARADILTAAASAFAERGFDGASIRGIATDAGVDPALVHHYFGGKVELFLESLQAMVGDDLLAVRQLLDQAPGVLSGTGPGLGARLVETFVRIWDANDNGRGLRMLIHAATGEARIVEAVKPLLLRTLLQLEDLRALDHAEIRVGLVASQMMGLGYARYVVGMPGPADLDPVALAAAVGPTVDRYLFEPLALGGKDEIREGPKMP